MMEYKGYIGKVDYDSDARIFSGSVVNTRTVITFQGQSVNELEMEFRNSVEDYLSRCKQDGVTPEKPYSGKFNVRIQPDLHQQAVITASGLNMSLNSFIEKSVRDEIAHYQTAGNDNI